MILIINLSTKFSTPQSVFRLFQNASTFRRKLFDVLLKMHLRLEQNSLVFWIKRKYVFRCLLSC